MEYKTKGKEGTGTRAQKECKLTKVNKKRSVKEEDGKAEDFSKNFPNFSVLTEEERLAFFEALSAARKNIEKQGLPTRERFGTVHDEYLKYFTKDEEDERAQKKPESASSARPSWSPNAVRDKAGKRNTEPSRKKTKGLKFTFPLMEKHPLSNTKHLVRPESAPVEFLIKRETDKVVQMYLDKKKRIENKSPPVRRIPQPRTTTRKSPLTAPHKESVPPTNKMGAKDPKVLTSFKAANTSQFQTLNFAERQEFYRILREAHDNILEKNPQKEIISFDEMLNPYTNHQKETIVYAAAKEPQATKKKTLRVKVTLTSGDNERLSKSKSQILLDCSKEELNERSKSLESLQSPDIFRGKQSKIPVLKRVLHETEECEERDSVSITKDLSECANETVEATEECKKQEPVKKKPIEEEAKNGMIKNIAKEKTRVIKTRDKVAEEATKECKNKAQEMNRTRNVGLVKLKAINLEKRKAEFRKALKEKENRAAEAARKEKELLQKKRVEKRRKRHYKRDNSTDVPLVMRNLNKRTNQLTDYCPRPVRVKKKIGQEKPLEKVHIRQPLKTQKRCPEVRKKPEKKIQEKTKEPEEECLEGVKNVKEAASKEEEECPVEFRVQEKTNEPEECSLADSKELEEKEEKKEPMKITMTMEEKDSEENKQLAQEPDKWTEVKQKKSKERTEGEGNAMDVKPFLVAAAEQVSGEIESLAEEEDSDREKSPGGGDNEDSEDSEGSSSEGSRESGICTCGRAESKSCMKVSSPEEVSEDSESVETDLRMCLCREESEHIVSAATQSGKSIGGVSLTEQRPEEIKEEPPCDPSGKTYLVDDKFVEKIKNLIKYLEDKVKMKDECESEYVRLVLSYTEYLAKVTQSLMHKNESLGQRVHSTYTAHEVHLKFDDKVDEKSKARIPRSISENEFYTDAMAGPSGIKSKPKEKTQRKESSTDALMLSDSESSSNSEAEDRQFVLSSFKKAGIPMTKIRLLQDLLKGRADFVKGSIDEFKIVHYPEPEFVPKDHPQIEKELIENEEDQGEKGIGMKFLKNLMNLCRCGRKQLEEEAILENLKGEAVRVDTIDGKKDPTSATINQSTMEVLKAAERKKIIDRYFNS